MDKFYLLVAGTRTFNDYPLLKETLDRILINYKDNAVIIEGEAKGADELAKKYAEEHGYECLKFPAAWGLYGKRAGYIRNREMHKELSKHENRCCVLFWDMESKGTKQNIGLCKEFETPLQIIKYKHIKVKTTSRTTEEELEL